MSIFEICELIFMFMIFIKCHSVQRIQKKFQLFIWISSFVCKLLMWQHRIKFIENGIENGKNCHLRRSCFVCWYTIIQCGWFMNEQVNFKKKKKLSPQEMEDFIFIFSSQLAFRFWVSLWKDWIWHLFYRQRNVISKWQLPNKDWSMQLVSLALYLHHTFGDSCLTHGADWKSYNFHCCQDLYFR